MKRIAFLVLALAISGCAYKHRPIYNVDNPTPRWLQDVSQGKMEDLIVAAAAMHDWKCVRAGDGHLVATQSREKFSATVNIYFDKQHWQIVYQDSVGLLSDGKEIHSHYNIWVHTLEHDIDQKFGEMAVVH